MIGTSNHKQLILLFYFILKCDCTLVFMSYIVTVHFCSSRSAIKILDLFIRPKGRIRVL